MKIQVQTHKISHICRALESKPPYRYVASGSKWRPRLTKKLTCVNVSVLLHVTLLVEPLSTVLAGIRSRVAAKRS